MFSGSGYGGGAPPALPAPAAAATAAAIVYTDPEEAILAALAAELHLQEELLQQELALFEEQRWGQVDQGQKQVDWQQQLQLSAALAPARQQQQQLIGGGDASALSSPAQSHYGTPRSSDLSGGYAGGRLSPFSARPASATARPRSAALARAATPGAAPLPWPAPLTAHLRRHQQHQPRQPQEPHMWMHNPLARSTPTPPPEPE